MSQTDTLKSLEALLVSFLEQTLAVKEDRLERLHGINQLDDIARNAIDADSITDAIGVWFAEHNDWLENEQFRPTDQHRIDQILKQIRTEIRSSEDTSPATKKISAEIDRWTDQMEGGRKRVVLTRGPEFVDSRRSGDTITVFGDALNRIGRIYRDLSGGRKHLLSVLDETLIAAALPENKDALLLSGFIIYYLKQNGYMVDPFVKRLKEAEVVQKGGGANA